MRYIYQMNLETLDMKAFKNIIIGFGKGGKTLAAFLAKRGESVALVERSPQRYGGTCINVACIPTKSLITQAEHGIDYTTAHKTKNKLVETLRGKNYDNLHNLDNVTIIDSEASFVSAHEIRVVQNETETVISGERIFINTGTEPFIPNIKGIDGQHIYNSNTLMQLDEIPREIVVIGGGFIGLEFAGMLLHFGVKVSLLNNASVFLPKEDRDIADVILQSLTARGLKIIHEAQVVEFTSSENKVKVYCEAPGETYAITTDAVLVATGRTPQTQKLNLEAAGISTDERGYVKVNDKLQTAAENVWAIGDVHGGPQFTYISLDDFRIIKNQLSDGAYNSLSKRKTFPTSVFITPPYARIGINETEAAAQGIEYSLFTLSASSIPKAAILKNRDGLLKALVDKKSGKILGCMLFCMEAHELINIVKVAMDGDLPYTVLRDAIYTHPTMAESLNELFQAAKN